MFLSLVLFALGAAEFGALPLRALSGQGEAELPRDLGVLYGAVDRADLGQHRELYASAQALAAARRGKPLPAGTELTMIVYAVARDAAAVPLKGDGGRFVKQAPLAYLLMRKRGAAHPSEAAEGAWQFQIFGPDKRAVPVAKLGACAACHEKVRAQDFVFSDEAMKAFARRAPAR